MKQRSVCCIFGTRPEVIKMAPIIHALQKKQGLIKTHVICTGQHRELLHPLINWFDLKVDANLDVMQDNQNLNTLASRLVAELGQLFAHEKYDCVVAEGDTTTVLMAGLAAFYARIPFAHVEAGLRTFNYDFPYPEEMNRVLVGRIASLHFAPTQIAADNLIKEGVTNESILISGNTVIDALHYTAGKLKLATSQTANKTILVTVHRRENFGEPLQRIGNALSRIASNYPDVRIILPVHPNPNVRTTVHSMLGQIPNISLLEPLPYEDLIRHMAESYLVVTDSGGIQEEAPAFKKPVLVMRDETERPELVALGGARLVGSNENLIVDSIEQLLTQEDIYKKMVLGYSPYGDGNSATAIVDKLVSFLTP